MDVPDPGSVPDATKWQIASRYLVHLAAMYEKVFRPVLADRYDTLEQEVWMQMVRFSAETARSLRLPAGSARELAESLRVVSGIVFGPDSKEEIIELGDDGAVIVIKRCPVILHDDGLSASGDGIFHRCMAFTLSAQNAVNPAYSARFVRAMCMGDRQCEIRIEPEKEPAKKPEDKKP